MAALPTSAAVPAAAVAAPAPVSSAAAHHETKEVKAPRPEPKGDEWRFVNTIRVLAAETVDKAKSGHPGAPMGMAPVAHVLWSKFMNHNPNNSHWANRDRFVLSNGHGCALLYTLLHLTGYKVTLDDLKAFRQLDSKTPGHPEVHHTDGVEVTTGPLGQGIANGVGLAIAQAHLAAQFNRPSYNLFDNYTYVFCGDGCLQEGVSGEASSLAGHLGLGKLIVIYDDNKITIDGETELSFTEDVPKRYEAYGWHTLTVTDGDQDLAGLEAAIAEAKRVTDRPSLISVKTTIGYGSTKEGTEAVHGNPLGEKDLAAAKRRLGFDPAKSFFVPSESYAYYGEAKTRGAALETRWNQLLAGYTRDYPKEGAELRRRLAGALPEGWKSRIPRYTTKDKPIATRLLSQQCLNALCPILGELVGGSADLTPSNMTDVKGGIDFQKSTPHGKYFRFGVREHGMAAIGNGMAAYGALLPYTATFFNFITYAWGAVRLSALSNLQQIYIMTHDSIGLGEDGPTHQPIEALALCRATPNITVFRPADGNETSGSYLCAVENKKGPSVLVLTRQAVPHLAGTSVEAVAKGGYVLQEPADGKAAVILIATGSEVSLAVDAAAKLKSRGVAVRVVSMPSTTLFDKQPVTYRRSVITPGVPAISIEALSTVGWERYAHAFIGMTTYGASAPLKDLLVKFGFTPDLVAARTQALMSGWESQARAIGLSFPGPLPTHFNAAL